MKSPIDLARAEVAEARPGRMKAVEDDPRMAGNLREVATLRSAEIELSKRLLAAREQQEAAKSGIGDTIVDALLAGPSDETGEPVQTVETVPPEDREAPIIAGINTARERRISALEDRPGIRASLLRGGELQALQKEAADHNKKAGAAMRKLEKVENCRFVPAGVVAVSAGAPVDSWENMIPLSEVYRARLETLEQEVTQAAGAKLVSNGVLTGRSANQIIEAVLTTDPTVLGPSVPDTLNWLAEVDVDLQARREAVPVNAAGRNSPAFFRLEYVAGEVDRVRSKVVLPAVDHGESGRHLIADQIRAGSESGEPLSGAEFSDQITEAQAAWSDKLISQEEFDTHVASLRERLEATQAEAVEEAEELAEQEAAARVQK